LALRVSLLQMLFGWEFHRIILDRKDHKDLQGLLAFKEMLEHKVLLVVRAHKVDKEL
jgi:hypothetical protein